MTHSGPMNYVPYDGLNARLPGCEIALTAEEMKTWRAEHLSKAPTVTITLNVNALRAGDFAELVKEIQSYLAERLGKP